MIIECSYCESKVDGKFIGEHSAFDPREDAMPFKVVLLECPVCKNSLVAGQELVQTGPDEESWTSATRLWPQPDKFISWSIPVDVRASLEEARRCYRAKAYSACAVMCGRALEGICINFETKSKILAGGLKELLDKKIIDDRLFQWGEELRKHRNIGAHATGEKILKADAQDLLDFANAICGYIFVLSKKFDDFMKRKAGNPAG